MVWWSWIRGHHNNGRDVTDDKKRQLEIYRGRNTTEAMSRQSNGSATVRYRGLIFFHIFWIPKLYTHWLHMWHNETLIHSFSHHLYCYSWQNANNILPSQQLRTGIKRAVWIWSPCVIRTVNVSLFFTDICDSMSQRGWQRHTVTLMAQASYDLKDKFYQLFLQALCATAAATKSANFGTTFTSIFRVIGYKPSIASL